MCVFRYDIHVSCFVFFQKFLSLDQCFSLFFSMDGGRPTILNACICVLVC